MRVFNAFVFAAFYLGLIRTAGAQDNLLPHIDVSGPDPAYFVNPKDPDDDVISQAWDKITNGRLSDAEDLVIMGLKDRPYDLRLKAVLFDVYIGAHRYEEANRLLKVYFEIPHVCETAFAIDRDLAQPFGARERFNTLAPLILRGVCIQAALGTHLDKARSDYCTYYIGRYFGHLEEMGSPPPVKLPNNSLEVALLAVGAESACHGELEQTIFYFRLAKQRFPKSRMAIAALLGLHLPK